MNDTLHVHPLVPENAMHEQDAHLSVYPQAKQDVRAQVQHHDRSEQPQLVCTHKIWLYCTSHWVITLHI